MNWANSSPVLKQVKSLVAPPGAGKSWFLRAVQEKLIRPAGNSRASPEWLVIFCEAPRLVNRDKSPSAALNLDEVLQWLEGEIQRAALFCPAVHSISVERDVEIAAWIAQLIDALCDQCTLRHPVVVLVDGLDEVTPDQAAKIEWQILVPFIARKCVRLVIAHRDEDALWRGLRNDTLRRNDGEQSRLRLSDLPSVRDQFEKFKNKFCPHVTHLTTTNLDQFRSSLKHYQWNHPYINAFLFDKALKRTGNDLAQFLTANDLRECLFAVVERRDENNQPRFEQMREETFACLKHIAKALANNWTEVDLGKFAGLQFSDTHVDWLFRHGILFTHPKTRRHKIAEGLRELVRDLMERGG